MTKSVYVKSLISSCENLLSTAMAHFNNAQENLMNDKIDFDNLYLSKFFLNVCIGETEKLLEISSEYPSLFEDKEREALETNLKKMKKNANKVEEMLDYCREQQTETH